MVCFYRLDIGCQVSYRLGQIDDSVILFEVGVHRTGTVEDGIRFNDQCTGVNPRYPLMSEIKEIYLKAYYGK